MKIVKTIVPATQGHMLSIYVLEKRLLSDVRHLESLAQKSTGNAKIRYDSQATGINRVLDIIRYYKNN